MRPLFAALIFAIIFGATAAQAEKRVFIIANHADGYGIDRCLAAGARCGQAAATAYCKSHEFASAVSFRKVDRTEITGTIPAEIRACRGRHCEEFIAIECAR